MIDDINKTAYSIGISQENSLGFNTVAPNNGCSPQQNPSRPYPCLFPTTNTGYTRLGTNGQLSQEWSPGQELGLTFFATKIATSIQCLQVMTQTMLHQL